MQNRFVLRPDLQGDPTDKINLKSLLDQNYFECAHWLQAAMDVENIWPDGIPNIKARMIEPLDGPAWTSGAGTDLNGSVWASLN